MRLATSVRAYGLDARFADESGKRLGHDEADDGGGLFAPTRSQTGAALRLMRVEPWIWWSLGLSGALEWTLGFDVRTTTLRHAGGRTPDPFDRDI
jgi:hypothetical protein